MSKKFWMGSFVLLFLSAIVTKANAVSAIDGFNPNANGLVRSVVVQSDGKILIGGDFTKIGGQTRNRIARLNADGTVDAAFNPDANSPVHSIVVQSDGKILVGGLFTKIGNYARNGIARLDSGGTVDPTFNPSTNNPVSPIAIQSDGKIVISEVLDECERVVRLNTNGTIDETFNSSNVDGCIMAILIQSDGGILIGGYFTNIGDHARNCLARLNSDGIVDTIFNLGADIGLEDVRSIVVQPDGKILIGGSGTAAIIRLNPDRTVDTGFRPYIGFWGVVISIAIQSDGKILVGGLFLDLHDTVMKRINPDGTLDVAFDDIEHAFYEYTDSVYCVAVQSDGKILIGGNFTKIGDQTRNYIARLNPDGTLDATLDPNANNSVCSISVQSDGKILVGGYFTKIWDKDKNKNEARNRIARLNSDGTLDAEFNPNVELRRNTSGGVSSIAVQSDGKILVGGFFAKVKGGTRNNIARLNPDGTLDPEFNTDASGGANANDAVYAISVQPDGKILVGGNFTKIGGQTRNRIARLNSDGTLDSEFNTNVNGGANANDGVYSISVRSDGKILVGGRFTQIGNYLINHIGMLRSDGTVDSFNPDASGNVYSISVQSDGKILVCGDFTGIDSQTRNRIARLNPDGTLDSEFNTNVNGGANANGSVYSISVQSDGKILVGGVFTKIGTKTRNRIARLNSDGTVDTTLFDQGANRYVYSIISQSDGKILVGGCFTRIEGQARSCIARLTNTGASFQDISTSADRRTITWKRSGTGPELCRVTFEVSYDMRRWITLGTGSHVDGGWEVATFAFQKNLNMYVRARGYTASGMYNGSTSIIESVKNIYLLDE